MTDRKPLPLLSYKNSTQTPQTMIIEPWAHEYTIFPGEQVDLRRRGGLDGPLITGDYFELHQTPEYLVFYWNGTGEISVSLWDVQPMIPFERREPPLPSSKAS